MASESSRPLTLPHPLLRRRVGFGLWVVQVLMYACRAKPQSLFAKQASKNLAAGSKPAEELGGEKAV